MKLNFSKCILFISITFIALSNANNEHDPEGAILSVAKCGYNCWPKYGADAEADLNVHRNEAQLIHNHLDDYQIGELRGCMEECLIKETDTDFYPPLVDSALTSLGTGLCDSEGNTWETHYARLKRGLGDRMQKYPLGNRGCLCLVCPCPCNPSMCPKYYDNT